MTHFASMVVVGVQLLELLEDVPLAPPELVGSALSSIGRDEDPMRIDGCSEASEEVPELGGGRVHA